MHCLLFCINYINITPRGSLEFFAFPKFKFFLFSSSISPFFIVYRLLIIYQIKMSSNKELEEFLLMEKTKAQVNAQIHEFHNVCWDKCVDKPGSKLDSKTETCLTNCVDRFIDVSLLLSNRFANLLQKNAGENLL